MIKRGSELKAEARQAKRRRRRTILAGLIFLAAVAAFLFWGMPGCSRETELSSSSGMASGDERLPRLELLEVDEPLTQQAQAGSLKLSALPPGRLCLFRLQRDSAGNRLRDFSGRLLRTPWVVTAPPLLDRSAVERVTNPGSDGQGRPLLAIEFSDEGAARLTGACERLAAARGSGQPPRLAVVIDGEVKGVVSAAGLLENGTLAFCGLPVSEAMEIAAQFAPAAT